jgi:hypothetical protein
MNYIFKVVKTGPRKVREESGEIKGPEAFGMAYNLALHWAALPGVRTVNLLRANTVGINSGKFFLHQIVKV